MTYRKKAVPTDPAGGWAAPTVAWFPDQQARDGFLRSVAASADSAWEATPAADDDRVALVRWREGHFLRLNDIAYAQHGSIKIVGGRR